MSFLAISALAGLLGVLGFCLRALLGLLYPPAPRPLLAYELPKRGARWLRRVAARLRWAARPLVRRLKYACYWLWSRRGKLRPVGRGLWWLGFSIAWPALRFVVRSFISHVAWDLKVTWWEWGGPMRVGRIWAQAARTPLGFYVYLCSLRAEICWWRLTTFWARVYIKLRRLHLGPRLAFAVVVLARAGCVISVAAARCLGWLVRRLVAPAAAAGWRYAMRLLRQTIRAAWWRRGGPTRLSLAWIWAAQTPPARGATALLRTLRAVHRWWARYFGPEGSCTVEVGLPLWLFWLPVHPTPAEMFWANVWAALAEQRRNFPQPPRPLFFVLAQAAALTAPQLAARWRQRPPHGSFEEVTQAACDAYETFFTEALPDRASHALTEGFAYAQWSLFALDDLGHLISADRARLIAAYRKAQQRVRLYRWRIRRCQQFARALRRWAWRTLRRLVRFLIWALPALWRCLARGARRAIVGYEDLVEGWELGQVQLWRLWCLSYYTLLGSIRLAYAPFWVVWKFWRGWRRVQRWYRWLRFYYGRLRHHWGTLRYHWGTLRYLIVLDALPSELWAVAHELLKFYRWRDGWREYYWTYLVPIWEEIWVHVPIICVEIIVALRARVEVYVDLIGCLPLDLVLTPLYPARGLLPTSVVSWLGGIPQRWAGCPYPLVHWATPLPTCAQWRGRASQALSAGRRRGAEAWELASHVSRGGAEASRRQRQLRLHRRQATRARDRDRLRQIFLHPRAGDLRVRGAIRLWPAPQLVRRLCGVPAEPYLPIAPLWATSCSPFYPANLPLPRSVVGGWCYAVASVLPWNPDLHVPYRRVVVAFSFSKPGPLLDYLVARAHWDGLEATLRRAARLWQLGYTPYGGCGPYKDSRSAPALPRHVRAHNPLTRGLLSGAFQLREAAGRLGLPLLVAVLLGLGLRGIVGCWWGSKAHIWFLLPVDSASGALLSEEMGQDRGFWVPSWLSPKPHLPAFGRSRLPVYLWARPDATEWLPPWSFPLDGRQFKVPASTLPPYRSERLRRVNGYDRFVPDGLNYRALPRPPHGRWKHLTKRLASRFRLSEHQQLHPGWWIARLPRWHRQLILPRLPAGPVPPNSMNAYVVRWWQGGQHGPADLNATMGLLDFKPARSRHTRPAFTLQLPGSYQAAEAPCPPTYPPGLFGLRRRPRAPDLGATPPADYQADLLHLRRRPRAFIALWGLLLHPRNPWRAPMPLQHPLLAPVPPSFVASHVSTFRHRWVQLRAHLVALGNNRAAPGLAQLWLCFVSQSGARARQWSGLAMAYQQAALMGGLSPAALYVRRQVTAAWALLWGGLVLAVRATPRMGFGSLGRWAYQQTLGGLFARIPAWGPTWHPYLPQGGWRPLLGVLLHGVRLGRLCLVAYHWDARACSHLFHLAPSYLGWTAPLLPPLYTPLGGPYGVESSLEAGWRLGKLLLRLPLSLCWIHPPALPTAGGPFAVAALTPGPSPTGLGSTNHAQVGAHLIPAEEPWGQFQAGYGGCWGPHGWDAAIDPLRGLLPYLEQRARGASAPLWTGVAGPWAPWYVGGFPAPLLAASDLLADYAAPAPEGWHLKPTVPGGSPIQPDPYPEDYLFMGEKRDRVLAAVPPQELGGDPFPGARSPLLQLQLRLLDCVPPALPECPQPELLDRFWVDTCRVGVDKTEADRLAWFRALCHEPWRANPYPEHQGRLLEMDRLDAYTYVPHKGVRQTFNNATFGQPSTSHYAGILHYSYRKDPPFNMGWWLQQNHRTNPVFDSLGADSVEIYVGYQRAPFKPWDIWRPEPLTLTELQQGRDTLYVNPGWKWTFNRMGDPLPRLNFWLPHPSWLPVYEPRSMGFKKLKMPVYTPFERAMALLADVSTGKQTPDAITKLLLRAERSRAAPKPMRSPVPPLAWELRLAARPHYRRPLEHVLALQDKNTSLIPWHLRAASDAGQEFPISLSRTIRAVVSEYDLNKGRRNTVRSVRHDCVPAEEKLAWGCKKLDYWGRERIEWGFDKLEWLRVKARIEWHPLHLQFDTKRYVDSAGHYMCAAGPQPKKAGEYVCPPEVVLPRPQPWGRPRRDVPLPPRAGHTRLGTLETYFNPLGAQRTLYPAHPWPAWDGPRVWIDPYLIGASYNFFHRPQSLIDLPAGFNLPSVLYSLPETVAAAAGETPPLAPTYFEPLGRHFGGSGGVDPLLALRVSGRATRRLLSADNLASRLSASDATAFARDQIWLGARPPMNTTLAKTAHHFTPPCRQPTPTTFTALPRPATHLTFTSQPRARIRSLLRGRGAGVPDSWPTQRACADAATAPSSSWGAAPARRSPSGFSHRQRFSGPTSRGAGAAPLPQAHPGGGAYAPPQPYDPAVGVLWGLARRVGRELSELCWAHLSRVWAAYRPPAVARQVSILLRATGEALLHVGKLLCTKFWAQRPPLPGLPPLSVGSPGPAAFEAFMRPAAGGFWDFWPALAMYSFPPAWAAGVFVAQCLVFLVCFWQSFRGAWALAFDALLTFSLPPALPEPYRVSPLVPLFTRLGSAISAVNQVIANSRTVPRRVDVGLTAISNEADVGLGRLLGAFARFCLWATPLANLAPLETPAGWARSRVHWVEDGGSHNPLDVADYGRDPVGPRRQRLWAPASTAYAKYKYWMDFDAIVIAWDRDLCLPIWLLNFLLSPWDLHWLVNWETWAWEVSRPRLQEAPLLLGLRALSSFGRETYTHTRGDATVVERGLERASASRGVRLFGLSLPGGYSGDPSPEVRTYQHPEAEYGWAALLTPAAEITSVYSVRSASLLVGHFHFQRLWDLNVLPATAARVRAWARPPVGWLHEALCRLGRTYHALTGFYPMPRPIGPRRGPHPHHPLSPVVRALWQTWQRWCRWALRALKARLDPSAPPAPRGLPPLLGCSEAEYPSIPLYLR